MRSRTATGGDARPRTTLRARRKIGVLCSGSNHRTDRITTHSCHQGRLFDPPPAASWQAHSIFTAQVAMWRQAHKIGIATCSLPSSSFRTHHCRGPIVGRTQTVRRCESRACHLPLLLLSPARPGVTLIKIATSLRAQCLRSDALINRRMGLGSRGTEHTLAAGSSSRRHSRLGPTCGAVHSWTVSFPSWRTAKR